MPLPVDTSENDGLNLDQCSRFSAEEELAAVSHHQAAQQAGSLAVAHCPDVIPTVIERWHKNESAIRLKTLILGVYETQSQSRVTDEHHGKYSRSKDITWSLVNLERSFEVSEHARTDLSPDSELYLEQQHHAEEIFSQFRLEPRFRRSLYGIPQEKLHGYQCCGHPECNISEHAYVLMTLNFNYTSI